MGAIPYYVNMNEMGSRFAEPEEIRKTYSSVPLESEGETDASGIPIMFSRKQNYLVTDNSDTNTITVSSTGTGKSRRVLMPQLISIAREARSSVIIHDPKAELYEYTAEMFRERGYRIITLNFRSPMTGDRFNPLEFIAGFYKAGECSKAIEMYQSFANAVFSVVVSTKDPFWHMSAGRYFVGLAIVASEIYEPRDVTLYNIYNLHIYGNEKGIGSQTPLKELSRMDHINELAYKYLTVALDAPNDTRASIYSVFDSVISAYTMNMDIVDMTTRSTFTVDSLVEQKTALYLITRDEMRVYDNYVASLIDFFYQRLVDIATGSGGMLPRRVEFVLDEMSNMSRINDIDRKVSASRSRNIRWNLCIQSLEQLAVVYGEDVAKVIIGNCNNILYLYSPDISLLQMLSTRCGNHYNEYLGVTEPLISVERLGHLEIGTCLMLLGRHYPFMGYLPDISEYPGIKRVRAQEEKKRERQEQRRLDLRDYMKELKREKIRQEQLKEERRRAESRMASRPVMNPAAGTIPKPRRIPPHWMDEEPDISEWDIDQMIAELEGDDDDDDIQA